MCVNEPNMWPPSGHARRDTDVFIVKENVTRMHNYNYNKRSTSSTPSNTHFLTHSLLLVEIQMCSIKSCELHVNLMRHV